MFARYGILALIVLGVSSTHVDADMIAITNPSFEEPAVAPDDLFLGNVPGWGFTFLINVPIAPEGSNVTPLGGTQTLATGLTPSSLYTLTVSVGKFEFVDFAGYDIRLFADTTLLANVTDATGPIPLGDSFTDVSLTYLSPESGLPGGNLRIAIGPLNSDGQVVTLFDNVRLSVEAVPEAGSLTMLFGASLAFGGAFVFRKRKRKAVT